MSVSSKEIRKATGQATTGPHPCSGMKTDSLPVKSQANRRNGGMIATTAILQTKSQMKGVNS